MAPLNVAQVRAAVVANRRTGDTRSVLALRADPQWASADVIDVGNVQVRIVPARSPLAVRDAMLRHDEANDETLVILTPCTNGDLGLDVCARFVKGTVVPIDPYAAIHALFDSTVLDPQLVEQRWLLEDLIALAPAHGWLEFRPVGGVLDAATAWAAWQRARLGLEDPPVDLAGVIALGARPEIGAVLAELHNDRRAALARSWAGRDDSLIGLVVDLLAAGRGEDLLALGLVAAVCWAPTDDAALAGQQTLARVRLESVFGRDRLDSRATAAWGDTVATIVADNSESPAVYAAAENILASLDAVALAALSPVLPRGFEERLLAFAAALRARDVDAATDAFAAVRAHDFANRRRHRVEMAAAALRLLRRDAARRAVASAADSSVFAALADEYAVEGAWVDEARGLLVEGESVTELASAYEAIGEAAGTQQAQQCAVFAAALADWTASEPLPDDRIVPVERILDDVVVGVAKVAPVLVVVCDGMGLAVTHALLRDLLLEGWARAVPAARSRWPVGVATIPTVTETSRASLLAGRRIVGGQKEEREGFTAHQGLRGVSAADRPPVLFHKGDLIAPNGKALPDDVRGLVTDPAQRIVGVVVNSVDDHLARGDQVRVPWDLASLRPLSWLLDAAGEAGRIVVLTADHGHVLQGPSSVARQLPGGGERWRPGPPGPGDGEIEISGPRVLHNDGRVIVPSDDRLRYGGYKYGYHGGATPQEVLVPVAVLAHPLPEGWEYEQTSEPSWWSTSGAVVAPQRKPVAPPVPSGRRSAKEQARLFDVPTDAPAVASPSAWVDALLRSAALTRQRERLPRPVPDDRLRRYIDAIEQNGGTIPLVALAERTGEPPDALRMALALVQRLLNVDAAGVLTVHADGTVELNRALLFEQFELDEP